MVWKLFFLTWFLLFSRTLEENDDEDEADSDEIFIPKREWKVIKNGQKVPVGLHYRINPSTGKKEAKINDDKEEYTYDIKGISLMGSEKGSLVERMEKDTDRYYRQVRRADELKVEMSDELLAKTELEIIRDLIHRVEQEDITKDPTETTVLHILRILEQVTQHVNNALEFLNTNAFGTVLYPKLNSTNVAVRYEALKLFSTLAQASPDVQLHVLDTGGVTVLMRLLSLDTNPRIKSNAVSALISSLKAFPPSQNKFIDMGGLTIFTTLFKSTPLPVQLKMVTLMTDLIVERQEDRRNMSNYKHRDVEQRLYELGWCQYFNEVLLDFVRVDVNDHDSQEKILLAMKSMVNKCHASYDQDLLLELFYLYGTQLQGDNDDINDHFEFLRLVVQSLIEGWRLDGDDTSGYGRTVRNKDEL